VVVDQIHIAGGIQDAVSGASRTAHYRNLIRAYATTAGSTKFQGKELQWT